MGDWAIGRLGDWAIGRLGDWAIGRLGDWGGGKPRPYVFGLPVEARLASARTSA
ncbi:hypothetical protein [Runella rosea]|uniref:hypothetical protein n=1 Tax=Runella rosea TaxID=2259595 RepID=UPI0013B42E72|nr:hypothetical protein [Runella rosea]